MFLVKVPVFPWWAGSAGLGAVCGACRVVCSILRSQPWDLVSKIKESHVMCCHVTLGVMLWPPH